MKQLFLKTTLLLFAITFFNCEDNTNFNNDSVGNDTFSCYINGKLYTPSAGTGINGGDIRPFSWTFEPDKKVFSIYTRGEYRIRITSVNTIIGNNILNEELGDTFDFSHSGMIVQNSLIFYNTKNNQNNGTITFTEFSETTAIGTFDCTLYNYNGDELKVTDGKFNLSLDSRTN
jgi:hypothetical protein